MKNTLNTILLTSVLAVPTTFGADLPTTTHEPDVNHGTQSVTNRNPLAEFGLASNSNKSFIEWLRFVTTIDFQKSSVTKKDLENAKASIDKLWNLSLNERQVLKYLLNQSTPADIIKASFELTLLGKTYHKIAYDLFAQAANHTQATPKDIIAAGNGIIRNVGNTYHEIAADLFIKAANHALANSSIIAEAADSLSTLGEAYHEKAAELYILSAKHSQATAMDINVAGEGLIRHFGKTYIMEAAELFILSTNHSQTTANDIRTAAVGLSNCGEGYHELAADFFVKAGMHHLATSRDTLLALFGLKRLGEVDSHRALELEKLAEQKELAEVKEAEELEKRAAEQNSASES